MLWRALLTSLLLYMLSLTAKGARRSGVIVTGTTPNAASYKKVEGSRAVLCPPDHKYAIEDNTLCCKYGKKWNAPNVNPECDGQEIDAFTPKECCAGNSHVKCSHNANDKCRSAPVGAVWNSWAPWGSCFETDVPNCLSRRTCNEGSARFGGSKECVGTDTRSQDCGCQLPTFASCNATSYWGSGYYCESVYDESGTAYYSLSTGFCPGCIVLFFTFTEPVDLVEIEVWNCAANNGAVKEYEIKCTDPLNPYVSSLVIPDGYGPGGMVNVTLSKALPDCKTIRVEAMEIYDRTYVCIEEFRVIPHDLED